MSEGKIQDFPVAGSSDTASPSEALSDGGLTAAGTEGSNGEDGFDYEEIESMMEAIDELHEEDEYYRPDVEDVVSDETMWTDSSEEDEEPEELGVDDAFFPGDGLLSVDFFFVEDGPPLRLARRVVEGKDDHYGNPFTFEHVAEAIKDLQDPDIKGREMSLAKRLIKAVSHQLEGATK